MLIIRAEPMAFRTLPVFLQMIKAVQGDGGVQMRGILLTLPRRTDRPLSTSIFDTFSVATLFPRPFPTTRRSARRC